MWRAADIDFVLIDDQTSDPIVTVEITTPAGRLLAMAEPLLIGRSLILRGFRMHGERRGVHRVGVANLRLLARVVLERMDLDELAVEGAVPTTGANPGHRPRPFQLSRGIRAEPDPGPG